jgi:hypothetical protein
VDERVPPLFMRLGRALREEMAARGHRRDIFFDEIGLRGGDYIDPKLSVSLCRSACMVVFYNSKYFDPEAPYCGQEYLGMLDLEARRRRFVPSLGVDGLIIPVILRSGRESRLEISRRKCFEYTYGSLVPAALDQEANAQRFVAEIAESISARYELLVQAGNRGDGTGLSRMCEEFILPNRTPP